MCKYNNKQRSVHWRGKVWITPNGLGGGNICIDPNGDDNFKVIAYRANGITEEVIRMEIESYGYNPDDYL